MIAEFKSLTLGVIGHKRFWGDPEGIKTMGGFGRQIEELSRYFGKTVLIVPFEKRLVPEPGYIIRIDNLEIVPLPYFNGTSIKGKLDFLTKVPQITRCIWHVYQCCDLLHYRMPGYVGTLGLLIHKIKRHRPGFVWIGTDWPERILQTNDIWYRRLLASISERLLVWLVQDITCFAVGLLAERYKHYNPHTHSTTTTVLSEKDIAVNTPLEISSPPRLLFVGRLAPEKGIGYLIEALNLCEQEGVALDLTIIGDGAERGYITELVTRHGLTDRVHFMGYIPMGEDLLRMYRQADLFVFPSLSEGQPKVLVEAMAAGLPIIATRVGGIPTIIEHGKNGLLVEPRSPSAIADTIKMLVYGTELRNQLARNARLTAHECTIEQHTKKLVQQLALDLQAQGWLRRR